MAFRKKWRIDFLSGRLPRLPARHRVFCFNLFPSVKGFPRHPLARAVVQMPEN